eukprot:TRINITY_DN469_c0_g1_i2.p1 TRINITY_DN469_c0_g1~~TRINITY_DN469_c0_g1_i2.p1  ORF type:complete len:485 (+),score=116.35 TRINITY_DN469_c0_g1_i2:64-1518(+)
MPVCGNRWQVAVWCATACAAAGHELPPHPEDAPEACGLSTEHLERYGRGMRLCDADGVLSASERLSVAHHLAAVRVAADGLVASAKEASEDAAAEAGRCMGVELGLLVQQHHTGTSSPAEYCKAAFNHWGLGRRGCDNGVLVYVAPGSRKIHICTGNGARDAPNYLSDSEVASIIDAATAYLKEGETAEAVRLIAAEVIDRVAGNVARGAGRPADIYYTIAALLLLAVLVFGTVWLAERRQRKERAARRECSDKLSKIHREYAAAKAQSMGMLEASCPICLDDFPPVGEDAAKAKKNDCAAALPPGVRVLRCGHCFHEDCIAEWLERQKEEVCRTCPVCRQDVDTGEPAMAAPEDGAQPPAEEDDVGSDRSTRHGLRDRRPRGLAAAAEAAASAAGAAALLLSDDLNFRLRRVQEMHPEIVSAAVWERWEARLEADDVSDLMSDVTFVANEYLAQEEAHTSDSRAESDSWGGGGCDGGGAGGSW